MVLGCRERADYYSVAIKSQFGVGRLGGHLRGRGTRQVAASIEMDDAVKAEPASLAWKCGWGKKKNGVATNGIPQQNSDATMNGCSHLDHAT